MLSAIILFCTCLCVTWQRVFLLRSRHADPQMQIGVLPTLVEVAPRMKPHRAAWLSHRVLIATSVFKDAAHFTHANTLLPPGPVLANLLGTACPWGALWCHGVAWRTIANNGSGECRLQFDGSITPGKLRTWLHALLASIVLPTLRAFDVLVQHHPSALTVWWRLIETLARRVLPHWLAGVLAPLLDPAQQGALQAADMPCRNTPPVPAVSQPQQAWNLGLAAAEFDMCAQLAAPRLPRALIAESTAAIHADSERGGDLVLAKLAFGRVLDLDANAVANSHKLALVLVHPDAAQRWPELHDFDPKLRHERHNFFHSNVSISMECVSRFRNVPEQRGVPGRCGAWLQVLPSPQWACKAAPAAQQGGARPATEVGGPAKVRFWMLQGRLNAMQQAGWRAHAVANDSWRGTRKSLALSAAMVVRVCGIGVEHQGREEPATNV